MKTPNNPECDCWLPDGNLKRCPYHGPLLRKSEQSTPSNELKQILDEIEERANKATAGPWSCDKDEPRVLTFNDPEYSKPMSLLGLNNEGMAIVFEEADAAFLLAARTDLPLLLKALRRAEYWFGIIENMDAPGKGAFGEKIEATTEYFYAKRAQSDITSILNQGRAKQDLEVKDA